jgi:hypothetical protein
MLTEFINYSEFIRPLNCVSDCSEGNPLFSFLEREEIESVHDWSQKRLLDLSSNFAS